MLVIIGELLLFLSGVVTGIIFRNKINNGIRSAVNWFKGQSI
jgi:hypothetical protein